MAFLKGCATTPRNGIKLNNDLSDVAKEASILLKPLKSVNPFMKQYPWWFKGVPMSSYCSHITLKFSGINNSGS